MRNTEKRQLAATATRSRVSCNSSEKSLKRRCLSADVSTLQPVQQMIRSFALESGVTLLNSEQRRGEWASPLSGHVPAGFAGSPAKPTPVAVQESVSFEFWCRERGLLIEVSDADYAEPRLAVIG